MEEWLKVFYLSAGVLALYLAANVWLQNQQKVDRTMAFLLLALAAIPLHNYSILAGWQSGFAFTIFLQALPIALLALGLQLIAHLADIRLSLKQQLLLNWPLPLVFGLYVASMTVPQIWMINAFSFVGCAYLAMYFGLIFWHRARLTRLLFAFQNSAACWMLYQVFGLALMAALKLVILHRLFQFDSVLDFSWTLSENLITAYLLFASLFYLWQPKLAEKFAANSKEPTAEKAEESKETEQAPANSNARKLELESDLAQSLAHSLEQMMQSQQLAQQENMDAKTLAALIGITPQQLSELLNVHLNISFYDYLNQFRLQTAETMLQDQSCQLSVLDIAFAAGFNNKNSF